MAISKAILSRLSKIQNHPGPFPDNLQGRIGSVISMLISTGDERAILAWCDSTEIALGIKKQGESIRTTDSLRLPQSDWLDEWIEQHDDSNSK